MKAIYMERTTDQTEVFNNMADFSVKSEISQSWLKEIGFKTIIDIGANEGQFASKMRKLFPNAMVYSFEPIPDVHKKLSSQFNGDKNFISYNCALGDKDENKEINLNEYNPSSSLLKMGEIHKKHFDFARKETSCPIVVRRLDDLISAESLSKPVLIKIDVQGFEDHVINGGKEVISFCRMIIIEVSFKELYIGQPLFDDIYKLLCSMGFKYSGNYEQLISPDDGSILQADAIFLK